VQEQRSRATAVQKTEARKARTTAERRETTHKSRSSRQTTTHRNTSAVERRPAVHRNAATSKKRTTTHRNTSAAERRTHEARATENNAIHNNDKIGKGKPGNGRTGKATPSHTRHADQRRHYATPDRRPVRKAHRGSVHHAHPVKYKKVYHYRVPGRCKVIWTPQMYREYRILYPEFHYWYYPTGYRIVTIPSWNAYYHVGEVRNVYGRVHEVWYDWRGDDYYLYFGGVYPYQDFTVIVPGRYARRFHRSPEAFFSGRYLWVTGLVSTFEGKPEIMVKRKHQVHLY
jgi:hypothetical protein